MNENGPRLTAAQAEFEEQSIHLREYLLVLLKRRWMILIVVVLAGTIGMVHSFRQTPVYRTSSTLYIDRPGYTFVPEVISDSQSWQGYDSFMNTQYKLLKSKSLAKRVIETLNLTANGLILGNQGLNIKEPPAGRVSEKQVKEIVEQILGTVEIVPVKGTKLCEIAFTTADPKLSRILANAWAEEYAQYSLASEYEYTQKAEELLDEQVKSMQEEIAEKEKILQDYSLEKQVVKLDKDRSMGSYMLEELNSALTTATKDRISREVHYFDLQSRPRQAFPDIAGNPAIQQLKMDYSSLERQYTEKSKTYKADYPEMIRIRSQMDQIRQRLEQETNDQYSKVLATARADYQEALNKEKVLQKELESSKRQSVETYRKEFDYDRLRLEIDNKKALLESLSKKRNETGVSAQVKEKKATMVRIVDRAELPDTIYKPNIRRNILFSLLIGFAAALGLAFVLEHWDRSLKNPEDLERYTQLPFLGIVPRYVVQENFGNNNRRAVVRKEDAANSPSEATYLMALYNPSSVACEALRTVRTSLLLSFPEGPPRSILITSSRPGEGKTFIACNLAISLAQLDKRVVLIDADMRNSQVHRIWSLRNNAGLSHFLTSNMAAENVIQPTRVNGLSLITSGAKTPRPAELLSSTRLEQLIRLLEQEFDHIILDSPPIVPVADSLILATRCSCVLMVIHGGVTPHEVVQMAKQKLSKSHAVIGGAVLNSVDLNDPYYYYSYYSNYAYAYGDNHNGSPKSLP